MEEKQQWAEGQALDISRFTIPLRDDFAIGFLDFIEGTYSYSNIFDYWYLHADTSKTFTKKQLVETYKKEKGL